MNLFSKISSTKRTLFKSLAIILVGASCFCFGAEALTTASEPSTNASKTFDNKKALRAGAQKVGRERLEQKSQRIKDAEDMRYGVVQRNLFEVFDRAPDTGMQGNLTPENLKDWLSRSGLLNVKLFKDPSCLTVARNDAMKGSSTQHLFFVTYRPNCAHDQTPKLAFIIKEAADMRDEVLNLNAIQKNPLIAKLGKLKDPSLPQMTFGEDFYFYMKNGEKVYFTLLHPAKGNSLWEDFKDRSQNPERAMAAFKKLGEVLGNFQKRFMEGHSCLLTGGTDLDACNTIVHGDLHANNVFYDGKFIYFIDMEGMYNSLEYGRASFTQDPVTLWTQAIAWLHGRTADYLPFYEAFLTSYVNQLSQNPEIRREIKEDIERKTHIHD